MSRIKFFALSLVLILAGASCQVPIPAAEVPAPDTQAPSSGITEVPPEQTAMITAGNLSLLQKSDILQASNSALTCGWSSDSQFITAMDTTWAGLYNTDGLELVGEFTGDETTALYAVSADASLAAYSLDGLTIQLNDFSTKADRFSITPDYQFYTVFFSEDGEQLAVASLDAIEVWVYNTLSGNQVNSLSGFETAAPVYSAAFSPDGSYLLWLSRGTAQPMEISSQSLKPVLSHEDFIAAAGMSHDNSLVATAAGGTLNGKFQPLVTLWDTKSGAALWQAGNEDYFSSLDFSPDDAILAAGTQSGVIFYDVASGRELSRFLTGGEVINSLGFSPDGQSLLACSTDGMATIWKVQ